MGTKWGAMQNKQSALEKMPSLIDAVESAKQDWICAQKLSQTVTDPDLVDYAAYLIKAYEAKYIYLLRQMKRRELPPEPQSAEFEQSGGTQG